MKQIKNIKVFDYNSNWPTLFQGEAQLIKDTLGQSCVDVHHIGSTSVPNLCAKDDIDILCVVTSLKESLSLQKVGYTFKGEINIPLRYYFSKNNETSKVNLHVCEADHGFIKLNLTFRDWLRTHDTDRDAYANLKHQLLGDPTSIERVDGKFAGYTLGKNDFIKSILDKAGYQDITYTYCIHYKEWEMAETLSGSNVKNLTQSQHMVMYKGSKIIGYAQITPGQTTKIWMQENLQSEEPSFRNFIEIWQNKRQFNL